MRSILRKMLIGKTESKTVVSSGGIEKRIQNIKAIWNNDHQDDVGIEKLFRLFLAASQFLFPGIYIKHIFGKKGLQYQDLAMDIYILFKVIFPFYLLYYEYIDQPAMLYVVLWFMVETVLYVPTLIFASDAIASPSSYRRSMLLLFLNYLEIVLAFALIYSQGNYLNKSFVTWYDPIYFSFITLGTIGFGDYVPVTGIGKLLVCIQSFIFLDFVVLFINYFSNKVESKGYFNQNKTE